MRLIMNDPLEQAIAEHRAAKDRADRLAAYIEARRKADELAIELGLGAKDQPAKQLTTSGVSDQPKSSAATWREQVCETAFNYMKKHGPMKTSKIVELLEACGFEFRAKNKDVAVSQSLGADPRFTPSRKYGWSISPESL
jgi:hypothetical protein